jgi:predicted  nucleic acid-binding Zn-ribbon protein
MGRFDREAEGSDADAVAMPAADALRQSIEDQVRQVVQDAMERASKIEDRAKVKADDIEREARHRADTVVRESQVRANRALSTALERAEGMRDATETLQSELAKVIDSFREEIDLLTKELRAAGQGPSALAQNPPGAPGSPASPEQPPPGSDPARKGILRRG